MRLTSLALALILSSYLHAEELHWFKGNTHTHSLWSDGNDFPEMISDWYASQGYDFLAMSDHNILAKGEKWLSEAVIEKRRIALGKTTLEKYRSRFGADWVQTRLAADGTPEIRLRPLEEYRKLLEKPGKFLLVQAEEISAGFGKVPIHIGAVNVDEAVQPIKDGSSITDVMRRNLQLVAEQMSRTGRPMFAHINHPNFQWALTAEDLANVVEDHYFEVFNGHPKVYVNGDETRIGMERMWDIANTIRIAELHAEALMGIASDDSHQYHGGEASPGRGWVMVHAKKLEANTLIEAMLRGKFYASTGVLLDEVRFDPASHTLKLKIQAKPGVHYHTVFRGTLKNYDRTVKEVKSPEGDPHPIRLEYSADVGKVLAESDDLEPSYKLTGDELYVRAIITSDALHGNTVWKGQTEQAWVQPVR